MQHLVSAAIWITGYLLLRYKVQRAHFIFICYRLMYCTAARLSCGSAAACLLGLWLRTPPEHGHMSIMSQQLCVAR